MGVGTRFTLVVESGLLSGVVLEAVLVDGVTDLRPSFFVDLGVAFGVFVCFGVELFSLPFFLPE